jgi:hypothetical protein
MEYAADFETTTDINDCRVWAWCVCEIDNPDALSYGTDIVTFLDFCKVHGVHIISTMLHSIASSLYGTC